MKTLVCLLVALAAVSATTYEDVILQEWDLYKTQFNKPPLDPRENLKRMNVFLENKMKIAEHNLKFAKGEVTYEMGLNELSDRFPEELAVLNGFRFDPIVDSKLPVYNTLENFTAPDEVNWVQKGAVTPVKNQGSCGSCYSFSAMGSLESIQHITKKKLIRLSEQNIVDCTGKYGNMGCNGGNTAKSLQYVKENPGVDTEASYPYEGRQKTCRFNKNNVGAEVAEVYKVKESEEALKSVIATEGPVSVSIHVTNNFHNYRRGVFYDSSCRNSISYINHAVLVVGYGVENGTPYWLVKNSWGTSWGENGYIKISRNKNNHCGIATYAIFPKV